MPINVLIIVIEIEKGLDAWTEVENIVLENIEEEMGTVQIVGTIIYEET